MADTKPRSGAIAFIASNVDEAQVALLKERIEDTRVRELAGQLQPDQPRRVISAASNLLSQLTQFAGLVVTLGPVQ